jgi:colanic acid biosynthesis glycosyl transferase WcaI
VRVAFVTQWFPPEPGTLVASAIAHGLADRGHQVDVLTGFPNYPTGKLHDGYRIVPYLREAISSQIAIHWAPSYPSHDRSAARRAANFISFAVAATGIARRRLPRPDAWLVYSSPATAVLPALLDPRATRAPICLIIQDLWPDSVIESAFLHGRLQRLAERSLASFCDWSYRHAAAIGVISPGMRPVLINRGVDPNKISSTPNWVVTDRLEQPNAPLASSRREALGLPAGRLFMYAGNLSELQGLEPLIDARAAVPTASLVLIGDGVSRARLQQLVADRGILDVSFVGSQPTERIAEFIAASDVQVVSLKDTPLLRVTMPSKVQAALASGRPILAHAAGDVTQVVSQASCGRSCEPGSITQTMWAIRSFMSLDQSELTAMGERGRTYYEQHFSATAGLNELEHMLNKTLAVSRFGGK